MFQKEAYRIQALKSTLPQSSSSCILKPVDKLHTYIDAETCIRDLIHQQQQLKSKFQIGFIWIQKIMFYDDPVIQGVRHYVHADIHMLCDFDASNLSLEVLYMIPSFPCKKFPKSFPQNIYEFALANWIQRKTPFKNFHGTKIGYFLYRCLKQKDETCPPLFI